MWLSVAMLVLFLNFRWNVILDPIPEVEGAAVFRNVWSHKPITRVSHSKDLNM